MRSPVLVKICGLSTPDTLEAALDGGADLVGFVFFPPSPRHVALETGARLAAQVRGRAEIATLVVDADDGLIDAIAASVAPDWLQLHGHETPERVRALKARSGRRIMKAVGIASRDDLAGAAHYRGVADRLLFDAKPPRDASRPGGNGRAFDWSILADLDPALPFMLSGGLTLDNVDEALQVTGAPGVDVSSGVETSPGIKDMTKIRAFIETVRRSAAIEGAASGVAHG